MPLYVWNEEDERLDEVKPARRLEADEESVSRELRQACGKGGKKDNIYIPMGSRARFAAWVKARYPVVAAPAAAAAAPAAAAAAPAAAAAAPAAAARGPAPVEQEWSMSWRDLLAGLALGLSQKWKRHVALLWNAKTHEIVGVGYDAQGTARNWQTAIVNVLQRTRGGEDLHCVSSNLPTSMCWGMAHVLKVNRVWIARGSGGNRPPMVKSFKGDALQEQVGLGNASAQLRQLNPLSSAGHFLETVKQRGLDQKLPKHVAAAVEAVTKPPSIDRRCWPSPSVERAFGTVPDSRATDVQLERDLYIRLVVALTGMTWSPKPDGPIASRGELASGNNVAAVLVHRGRIIGWGLNTLAQNLTFHAETIAIQTYLKSMRVSALPQGCTIYSSLQPCDMCAGFIEHVGNGVEVRYAVSDRELQTVLDSSKNENSATLYPPMMNVVDFRDLRQAISARFGADSTGTTSVLFDQREDRRAVGHGARARHELAWLEAAKANGEWLDQKAFTQLTDLKKAVPRPIAENALGLRFASFFDSLIAYTDGRIHDASPNTIAVAEQCLDLLWIAARSGMSTRYGVGIVAALIAREERRRGGAAAGGGGAAAGGNIAAAVSPAAGGNAAAAAAAAAAVVDDEEEAWVAEQRAVGRWVVDDAPWDDDGDDGGAAWDGGAGDPDGDWDEEEGKSDTDAHPQDTDWKSDGGAGASAAAAAGSAAGPARQGGQRHWAALAERLQGPRAPPAAGGGAAGGAAAGRGAGGKRS
ncbi:Bd3614 family nucleic acid deaminase [Myxococcus faecalis]|uniref:Bd3614 family nucleic acid deaminase n=1 Tax=Myxococcus faecalis TaxID=3115646 RepID=UPI003CF04DFA